MIPVSNNLFSRKFREITKINTQNNPLIISEGNQRPKCIQIARMHLDDKSQWHTKWRTKRAMSGG